MAEVKNKDLILETIDQLRKRKARPDIERICHMLGRKHGLSSEEIEADLEKLVDAEVVIKVDYKGNYSYRNAAKWRKSHLGGHVLNSNEASLKIQKAVSALTQQDGEGRKGADIHEIEQWIQKQYLGTDSHLMKSQLQIALNREVDTGYLEKLPNGRYVRSGSTKKAKVLSTASPTNAASPATAPPLVSPGSSGGNPKSTPGKSVTPSKRGRPAKRMRFKKSHGPDFETFEPKIKHERKSEERCDFCLLPPEYNRQGEAEDLLVCKDCSAKAHPSCMDYSPELARRARNSPIGWQCIDCKTCIVCDDSGDPDSMLFCDACDKGYHMKCHDPPLSQKPKGKWACTTCLEDGVGKDVLGAASSSESERNEQTEGNGPSCLPTPSDSPVSVEPRHNQLNQAEQVVAMEVPESFGADSVQAPAQLPLTVAQTPSPLKAVTADTDAAGQDASRWTIEDVAKYFKKAGFAEQAECFMEQEIDGASLLLMKRSDVLTGLSIKLGPALKIYNLITQLQTNV
ncbi:histone acetyltransferase KAT6B [Lingula anatina]|uniref:Histone acetyltransferase KAT6B n=1 Tax=Lingula anatina TaxID=7574 RepID=A0A1S3JT61_LINAN|nr:histone acetyltransferase KAT6B [Lingula anatina]|eukprot:XP_013413244.1 histone acetyltransferase KAT6B [Lingula anatina]